AQQPAQRDSGDVLGHLVWSQPSPRIVPAREPDNHSKKAECRGSNIDVSKLALVLELGQRVANKVEIRPLALVYLAPMRSNQASGFGNQNRHWIVALGPTVAGNQAGVIGNNRSKAQFRVLNGAGRNDDLSVQRVHAVAHDGEQELSFPLDMVVDAGLGDADSARDLAHRSGIIALLADHAGRNSTDFVQPVRAVQPDLFFLNFSCRYHRCFPGSAGLPYPKINYEQ